MRQREGEDPYIFTITVYFFKTVAAYCRGKVKAKIENF